MRLIFQCIQPHLFPASSAVEKKHSIIKILLSQVSFKTFFSPQQQWLSVCVCVYIFNNVKVRVLNYKSAFFHLISVIFSRTLFSSSLQLFMLLSSSVMMVFKVVIELVNDTGIHLIYTQWLQARLFNLEIMTWIIKWNVSFCMYTWMCRRKSTQCIPHSPIYIYGCWSNTCVYMPSRWNHIFHFLQSFYSLSLYMSNLTFHFHSHHPHTIVYLHLLIFRCNHGSIQCVYVYILLDFIHTLILHAQLHMKVMMMSLPYLIPFIPMTFGNDSSC